MHVLILALLLLWFVWPIGVAFVGLLVLLVVAKKNKKRWRRAMRRCARTPSGDRLVTQKTNSAFEEYRADVLHRLDAERAQFSEFLERLRKSEDKEAFDRFLSDRRRVGV